jgi:hypothetical protein
MPGPRYRLIQALVKPKRWSSSAACWNPATFLHMFEDCLFQHGLRRPSSDCHVTPPQNANSDRNSGRDVLSQPKTHRTCLADATLLLLAAAVAEPSRSYRITFVTGVSHVENAPLHTHLSSLRDLDPNRSTADPAR